MPSEVEERGSSLHVQWENVLAADTLDREEAATRGENVREADEGIEGRSGFVPSPPSLHQESVAAAQEVVRETVSTTRAPSIPLLNPGRERRNSDDINPRPGQVRRTSTLTFADDGEFGGGQVGNGGGTVRAANF